MRSVNHLGHILEFVLPCCSLASKLVSCHCGVADWLAYSKPELNQVSLQAVENLTGRLTSCVGAPRRCTSAVHNVDRSSGSSKWRPASLPFVLSTRIPSATVVIIIVGRFPSWPVVKAGDGYRFAAVWTVQRLVRTTRDWPIGVDLLNHPKKVNRKNNSLLAVLGM